MDLELIPLRPGARCPHYALSWGLPGAPAGRSNPRAIYTTWAPSWLSRRGAVRLTFASTCKIQNHLAPWWVLVARRVREMVLSLQRGAHFI